MTAADRVFLGAEAVSDDDTPGAGEWAYRAGKVAAGVWLTLTARRAVRRCRRLRDDG